MSEGQSCCCRPKLFSQERIIGTLGILCCNDGRKLDCICKDRKEEILYGSKARMAMYL